MTSSALMSIGMRAMFANNAALQSTGHNIANANVAGYSRQDTMLSTTKGQFTGAGFFGKGVDVVNVTRAHDKFLTMQAAASRSLAAMDEARHSQLQQLEDVFPPGTEGLGHAMGEFFVAMTDLASTPSDSSARQVVLARAADAADRFANAGARLDILQQGVFADLESSAATVNGLSRQVAELNQQIATFQGLNQEPNDLLDKRDALISEIGSYVQVTTLPAEDGTVGVFIAGGQRLVLGNEVSDLRVTAGDPDPSRAALSLDSNGEILPLSEDLLTGGSISGLLRYQNSDLIDARTQLGQMAAAFAGAVNRAQSLGLDLSDTPGPGDPMFNIGAPLALASRFNARDGSGNPMASVAMTVTDERLLKASEYELTPDPSGAADSFQLVRLSDGLTRIVANGESVDGFSINVTGAGMQAGDRFLLQPVSRAATGMSRALDDERGVAAASPVNTTFGLDNTGSASLDELHMTDGSVDTSLLAAIEFTGDSGDGGVNYTWELRDRITGSVTSSGTGTWRAGQPIELNGFALSLNGVPNAGDTVTVDKTLFPASNNGNALAMSSLSDDALVGLGLDADGNYVGGRTATDAYAATMSDIGVRVQSARVASEISASASDQAEATLASKTGVNLDEEASRLIQFQQSYQAAAKVLQVAQSIFDTMLQLGG